MSLAGSRKAGGSFGRTAGRWLRRASGYAEDLPIPRISRVPLAAEADEAVRAVNSVSETAVQEMEQPTTIPPELREALVDVIGSSACEVYVARQHNDGKMPPRTAICPNLPSCAPRMRGRRRWSRVCCPSAPSPGSSGTHRMLHEERSTVMPDRHDELWSEISPLGFQKYRPILQNHLWILTAPGDYARIGITAT
jgi:hypothetical protein